MRSRIHNSFLLLIFFILGQHPIASATGSPEDGVRIGVYGNHEKCPARDFYIFSIAFAEQEKFQRIFVADRIVIEETTDPTHSPSPKISKRIIRKDRLRTPLLLRKADLDKEGLERSVEVARNAAALIVRSTGEHSLGYYLEYRFKFISNCWFLVKIIDQST